MIVLVQHLCILYSMRYQF